jgi:6-phosphofructokinase 1
MLATRYGVGAIDLVHQGKFGEIVVLRGNHILSIPIVEAISKISKVGPELIDVALSLQDRRGNHNKKTVA